jgi:hypothetical protein
MRTRLRLVNREAACKGRSLLDTLGKLRAHGYVLFGWCSACATLHQRGALPGTNPPAFFGIDLALIPGRGARARVVGLRSVPCPRCGSRKTETRLQPPPYAAE